MYIVSGNFFLSILFITWAMWSQAQSNETPQKTSFNVDKTTLSLHQMYCFSAPNDSITLQQILTPRYQQQFIHPRRFNLGYSSGTHWVKIYLKTLQLSDKVVLELPGNIPKVVVFYPQWSDSVYVWKSMHTQIGQSTFYNRSIHYPANAFPLEIRGKPDTLAVYVCLKTNRSAAQLHFQVYKATYFQNQAIHTVAFNALIYGMIIVMIVYNFFMLLVLKESLYLLYVILELLSLLLFSISSGYYLYVLPNEYFWWYHNSKILWLLMIVNILFAQKLLNTHLHTPNMHRIFRWVTLGLLGCLLVNFWHSNARFSILCSLFTSLILLGYAIYLYSRGVTTARYYLLAWGFYVAGGMIKALLLLGIITSHHPFLLAAPQIGLALEAVFFSFALGHKINLIKKERYIAQQQALEKQQENQELIISQKATLEQKVKERTHQLESAKQEITIQHTALLHVQEELLVQQEMIEEQNQVLVYKQKHIDQSIKAAQKIQEAMLPFDQRIKGIFADCFVLNRPKDVVSGDFYWVETINNKVFVAIADCTGHGVPGAFMSMIGHILLDHIIKVNNIYQPGQVLEILHAKVQQALRQKISNDRNGMDIGLCLIENVDNTRSLLTFAGAKRPLYYWHAQKGGIVELKGTPKAIGGIQRQDISFANQYLHLPAGSIIYLSSDGYVDQNNPQRKKLGKRRFIELLQSCIHLSLSTQCILFEEELLSHMQESEQRDDILMVGIQMLSYPKR
ncbi:7TM diverse intracellular signaling domain-containing protein [uncultured Microscilla sp.]|uniref:7TM diverse intracellular signaling domain-containing protein n=1 Tax=uncultured Microscilla sp. TaxID=432653 RepID=UPI002601F1F3|nr:7TM diverse intracellular signaling domain-containing protein [uncultured Microscilla sp.]